MRRFPFFVLMPPFPGRRIQRLCLLDELGVADRAGDGDSALSLWDAQRASAFGAAVIPPDFPIPEAHRRPTAPGRNPGKKAADPPPDGKPPAEKPFVFLPALRAVSRHHSENAPAERCESCVKKQGQLQNVSRQKKNTVKDQQSRGERIAPVPPRHDPAQPVPEPFHPVHPEHLPIDNVMRKFFPRQLPPAKVSGTQRGQWIPCGLLLCQS